MRSFISLGLSIVALVSRLSYVASTAMDDYVWREDPNYSWFDTGEVIHGHNRNRTATYTGYILNMTSQRWLTDADTTRSLWWHYLVVIVPSNYNKEYRRNATLWITDGSNDHPDELPTRFNYNMLIASELAMGTGLITGCLFQIPNQHMTFAADPEQKSRSEDSIIAYTWAHFLDHPDEPEWLVRLPMVKASLRAMDTITAFVAQHPLLRIPDLDYFAVTGASKRGWTTWDVAAMDTTGRVTIIAPIVLDALNFVAVEHHQWRSYGGWSFFLSDYYEQNITARYDDPNMVKLQEIEDPFFYADRLTLPKLVVNAAADEFQQPDDTHYWWNDMPEPKHFLMMPNTEHFTITGFGQCLPAIGTWILHHVRKLSVPSIHWTISKENGDITATVTGATTAVTATMWYGHSCGGEDKIARRDFRMLTLDDPCLCGTLTSEGCLNQEAGRWYSKQLSPQEDGVTYIAHMDADPSGKWTAFFIDFTFESNPALYGEQGQVGNWPYDVPGQLDFTTEVSIWPDVFPFEDCSGADCYGTLL